MAALQVMVYLLFGQLTANRGGAHHGEAFAATLLTLPTVEAIVLVRC
jgi:hypothetical protein